MGQHEKNGRKKMGEPEARLHLEWGGMFPNNIRTCQDLYDVVDKMRELKLAPDTLIDVVQDGLIVAEVYGSAYATECGNHLATDGPVYDLVVTAHECEDY